MNVTVVNRDKIINFLNRPSGATLTYFLVVASSLSTYLYHNAYPIGTAEVGILVGLIALVSLVFGFVHQKVTAIGKYILAVLLLTFVIEIHFAVVGAVFIAIAGVFLLKDKMLPTLAVIFSINLISNPIVYFSNDRSIEFKQSSSDNDAVRGNQDKPFVLHIVLDAHIGREGLNAFETDPVSIQSDLDELYLKNGFTVYGGAYSQHLRTRNSLPTMLNFGENRNENAVGEYDPDMQQNRYFEYLEASGYTLKVLQSSWLHYCQSKTEEYCYTYAVKGPSTIRKMSFSAFYKASVIGAGFISLSETSMQIFYLYDQISLNMRVRGFRTPILAIKRRFKVNSLSGKMALDHIANEVLKAKPGEVYFAHILFPHAPYAYDKGCYLKNPQDWDYASGQSHMTVKMREASYIDQVGCSMKMVQKLLDNLALSEARNNNIVIIHGDHGAPISSVSPSTATIGQFSDRDIVTSASTLFAVRYQQQNSQYFSNHVSLENLFTNLIQNEFKTINIEKYTDTQTPVILNDLNWTPKLGYALPKDWSRAALTDESAPAKPQ